MSAKTPPFAFNGLQVLELDFGVNFPVQEAGVDTRYAVNSPTDRWKDLRRPGKTLVITLSYNLAMNNPPVTTPGYPFHLAYRVATASDTMTIRVPIAYAYSCFPLCPATLYPGTLPADPATGRIYTLDGTYPKVVGNFHGTYYGGDAPDANGTTSFSKDLIASGDFYPQTVIIDVRRTRDGKLLMLLHIGFGLSVNTGVYDPYHASEYYNFSFATEAFSGDFQKWLDAGYANGGNAADYQEEGVTSVMTVGDVPGTLYSPSNATGGNQPATDNITFSSTMSVAWE